MTTPRTPARPAPTARQARRPRSVAPLNVETIVDRAIALAERDGAAALTMRRLGEELGVDPTAVYRHFRDKDDLVLACYDRIVTEVLHQVRPRLAGADWRTVLRVVADANWSACQAHPAVFSLAFHRTSGGAGERGMVELLLGALATAGLSPRHAVLCYRAFVDAMLGLAGTQAAANSMEQHLQDKDQNAWTLIYGTLPQSEFPAARAHVEELATVTDRQVYDAVTESVISLVDRLVAETAAAPGAAAAEAG